MYNAILIILIATLAGVLLGMVLALIADYILDKRKGRKNDK